MRSSRGSGRAPRVSPERLAELAWHLTERDREIALCLFEQQLLATGQLTLLFFSSRRRAQDRLLFLARSLLPALALRRWQAAGHWLLDEPGAHLVAAMLGVERERLGWQRRRRLGLPPAAGASAGGQPLRHRSHRRHAQRHDDGGYSVVWAADGGRVARTARPSRRPTAPADGGGRRDRVSRRVGSRDRTRGAAHREARPLPDRRAQAPLPRPRSAQRPLHRPWRRAPRDTSPPSDAGER
jgi:hypothetical protein